MVVYASFATVSVIGGHHFRAVALLTDVLRRLSSAIMQRLHRVARFSMPTGMHQQVLRLRKGLG